MSMHREMYYADVKVEDAMSQLNCGMHIYAYKKYVYKKVLQEMYI